MRVEIGWSIYKSRNSKDCHQTRRSQGRGLEQIPSQPQKESAYPQPDLGLWPPELCEDAPLLFRPPDVWCFVTLIHQVFSLLLSAFSVPTCPALELSYFYCCCFLSIPHIFVGTCLKKLTDKQTLNRLPSRKSGLGGVRLLYSVCCLSGIKIFFSWFWILKIIICKHESFLFPSVFP